MMEMIHFVLSTMLYLNFWTCLVHVSYGDSLAILSLFSIQIRWGGYFIIGLGHYNTRTWHTQKHLCLKCVLQSIWMPWKVSYTDGIKSIMPTVTLECPLLFLLVCWRYIITMLKGMFYPVPIEATYFRRNCVVRISRVETLQDVSCIFLCWCDRTVGVFWISFFSFAVKMVFF